MSIRVAGRGFARALDFPLYDNTLTVAGNFDVLAIPPSHNHMQIIMKLRSDVAATNDVLNGYLNNDSTAANYRLGTHLAGNTHSSSQSDSIGWGPTTAASSPADYFSKFDVFIWNYADGDTKIIRINNASRIDATQIINYYYTIHWENTAAITQVTLEPDGFAADKFEAASRCQIRLFD